MQSISQKQSDLNAVSIDWCLPMSFTNLDQKQLGTSRWLSDHYLSFTHVLLFHFSCLESQNVPDGSKRGIKVFKRLQVIWFCLISRLFTKIAVPPSVIDRMSKFSSPCVIGSHSLQSNLHLMTSCHLETKRKRTNHLLKRNQKM